MLRQESPFALNRTETLTGEAIWCMGRRLPIFEQNGQSKIEATIRFALLEDELLQKFWQLIAQGGTLCYRDCAGNCLFGCVTQVQSEQTARYTQFVLKLCQVEYSPQAEDEVSV